MPRVIEGDLSAADRKFAIVASRFNHFITDRLMEGAIDALRRHGVPEDNLTIVRCPGSFEIPSVLSHLLANRGKIGFDAVICLGAVIRGDTPHFDYVAAEVTKGIANISLKSEVPIMMGIITADTIEQAIGRAGAKAGNKGFEAALGAIEMTSLFERMV